MIDGEFQMVFFYRILRPICHSWYFGIQKKVNDWNFEKKKQKELATAKEEREREWESPYFVAFEKIVWNETVATHSIATKTISTDKKCSAPIFPWPENPRYRRTIRDFRPFRLRNAQRRCLYLCVHTRKYLNKMPFVFCCYQFNYPKKNVKNAWKWSLLKRNTPHKSVHVRPGNFCVTWTNYTIYLLTSLHISFCFVFFCFHFCFRFRVYFYKTI